MTLNYVISDSSIFFFFNVSGILYKLLKTKINLIIIFFGKIRDENAQKENN